MNTGSAIDAAHPLVVAHEAVSVIDYSSTGPTEIFRNISDMTRRTWGYSSLTYQPIQIGDFTVDQYVAFGNGDAQKFMKIDKYATSTHLPSATNPLLPGGTNGGDIYWLNSDPIHATWIGQMTPSTGVATGQFGFTKFESDRNKVALVQSPYPMVTQLSSLTNANPGGWNAIFGLTPNISSVSVIQPTAVIAPSPGLTGTVAAIAPQTSTGISGPPIAFDGYTVANGIISATCPVGTGCGSPIEGAGFLQRTIDVAGKTYFQTIITGENDTGNPAVFGAIDFNGPTGAAPVANTLSFANESFVRPNANGLSSKLAMKDVDSYNSGVLTDPVTGLPIPEPINTLLTSATVNAGWALGGPAATAFDSHQLMIGEVPITFEFWHMMQADIKIAQNGSRDIGISQMTGTLIGSTDPIDFRTRILTGSYQTTAHTLGDPALLPTAPTPISPTITGSTSPAVTSGASNGGNIAWSAGDAIQATWIGGVYLSPGISGPTVISSTSYTNLSTGQSTAFMRLTDANPASWASPFGPPPTYSVQPCYDMNTSTYSVGLCGLSFGF
jgi:hypothetical protein